MANPSTTPRHGSTVAVASQTNAQLSQYYFMDTRVGAMVEGAPQHAVPTNGLIHLLADGRAGDAQDFQDQLYIKATLGLTGQTYTPWHIQQRGEV